MDRQQAGETVRGYLGDYLRSKGLPLNKPFKCLNPEHHDAHPSMSYNKRAQDVHCFSCGVHYSIFDLIGIEYGLSETADIFAKAYEIYGISIDKPEISPNKPRKTEKGINTPTEEKKPEISPTEATEDKPDFLAYYKECKAHLQDDAAQAYLQVRGISQETAARYWIGYDVAKKRLVIPVTRSFYVARDTTGKARNRYDNPAGVSVDLFNEQALYNDDARPVFITEGTINALSIIEAGGIALALNGGGNWRKVIDRLKDKRTRSTLVLCLDNDDAGHKYAADFTEALQEINAPYVLANICGSANDANEALTADRQAFIDAVGAAERATSKPDNTADYIRQTMGAEIDALKAQSNRKTGFLNLDAEAGSIYAGLYAVGGISSVGKTTFISQLADQMAAQGQHVLFFSMEQSRLEMVSKSIARQTAKADPAQGVSSLQIRTGAKGDSISKAITAYTAAVADRISIIEGNFNCTVGYISEYTKNYIARNGARPVVIIDYLQVLQAEIDPETKRKPTDTKAIVDHNVTELKRLSRALDIPVFVISSVNRSNYQTPIDFEAFKESGGIEYTADVVWGLQLSVLHDAIFDSDKKVKEKREKIAQAKAADPREIELVCLKNRYGKSRYSVQFKYYPRYDYFEAVDDFIGETITGTDLPFNTDVVKRI